MGSTPKTVALIQKGNSSVYINKVALETLGVGRGDYLIAKEEVGAKGPYIALYKPESPEDLELLDRHLRKVNTGE